ncbi:MAG TPA: hypothetical protein VI670_17415 [Thermoanaerobaculia bacterium]|jgi:hypothetical protein
MSQAAMQETTVPGNLTLEQVLASGGNGKELTNEQFVALAWDARQKAEAVGGDDEKRRKTFTETLESHCQKFGDPIKRGITVVVKGQEWVYTTKGQRLFFRAIGTAHQHQYSAIVYPN